ncbi:hypothetical protein L0337_40890 [candidate division KSB1 bacterium]|nr:hypothetical protein [candidate division KSB1 bacterium]
MKQIPIPQVTDSQPTEILIDQIIVPSTPIPPPMSQRWKARLINWCTGCTA